MRARILITSGAQRAGDREINYPFLFDWIERIGYNGWIGCEYKPKANAADGLGWIKGYLQADRTLRWSGA